jgi:ApbE superfamily uncharacterized protein (UPF0280 family)
MPLLSKRRSRAFDVPVHDMTLRITGPEELYEEARAVGMQFWEQLQSYAIRHPDFQTSKRPFAVGGDAPDVVRQMSVMAASAGVGPMFTFQGALAETVGRALGRSVADIMVVCGPDHWIVTRKRSRLALNRGGGGRQGELGIVVKPQLGPHGVHIGLRNAGRSSSDDVVVIVASSCILADAAAAGVSAILSKPNSLRAALTYVKRMNGVHGAMLMRGDRIGVAGGLELAV